VANSSGGISSSAFSLGIAPSRSLCTCGISLSLAVISRFYTVMTLEMRQVRRRLSDAKDIFRRLFRCRDADYSQLRGDSDWLSCLVIQADDSSVVVVCKRCEDVTPSYKEQM
jgi:hypothetical protein